MNKVNRLNKMNKKNSILYEEKGFFLYAFSMLPIVGNLFSGALVFR
jgi:hypothetical protein